MMQPEDRIESGGIRIGHESGLILRKSPTNETMHQIMRLSLDPSVHALAMVEAGVDATKAGAAAARHALEVGFVERIQVDVPEGYEHVAVALRAISLFNEQRVVAGAVRPVGGPESRRQRVLVGLEVVPVRQGPCRRPAGLHDCIANDRLECDEIPAVPRQEKPAAMLA